MDGLTGYNLSLRETIQRFDLEGDGRNAMQAEIPMRRTMTLIAVAATLLLLASGGFAHDDDDAKTSKARREATEALKLYGPLVGTWRGTGQPQRGRSQGSWTEKASWAWKLSKDTAALEIDIETGKYLKSALLKPGEAAGTYLLEAVLADGTKRTFKGKGEKDKPLALNADEPGEGLRRVTLTLPNELRFLILLEAPPHAQRWIRPAG